MSGSLGGGTPSGDSAVVVVAVVAADVEEEVEFLAADDSAVEGVGVGSSVLGSATVSGWSPSTSGSRGAAISCLLRLFRHDDQSAAQMCCFLRRPERQKKKKKERPAGGSG